MNKKGVSRLTLIILIIVGIIVILSVIGATTFFLIIRQTPQATVSTPSGKYIETPVFLYYECSPASARKTGDWIDLPEQGAWVQCPDNSDTCDIDIRPTEINRFLFIETIIYNKCIKNSNTCEGNIRVDVSDGKTVTLFNVRKDQVVFVEGCTGIACGSRLEGIQVRANFNPFILWKNGIFSGGRNEYTSIEQGCVFPTEDRKNLIERVINLVIPHEDDSFDVAKLEPFKTRNFIETFASISKANVNFVDYLGKTGYCLDRDIYSIATVETEGETYQIVDTNFNSIIKSNVNCCPGEVEPTRTCNSNFEWEEIAGSECSLFNPCTGIEFQCFGAGATQRKFNCENGFCVQQTKEVECCTDADCINSEKGKFCDSFTNECSGIPDINITKKEDCSNNIDDDGDGFIDLDDNDCQDAEKCPPYVIVEPGNIVFKDGITFPNIICKIRVFFEEVRLIASAILGLLAGLIGLSYTIRFTKKVKKRTRIILSILAFLILGLSLGYLAFIAFWWIVLALIIFGIMKALIPGI